MPFVETRCEVTPITLVSKYYRVYSTVGWSQVNPISLCNGEVLHNQFEERVPDTFVVRVKVLYIRTLRVEPVWKNLNVIGVV